MALTKIPSSLLDTSGGFDLQGNITLGDNERIQFGDGTDLQIYHSGANSFITDTGTGNLNIKTNDGNGIYLLDATGNMADFTSGGAVTLRYNNDAKIATSSAGATVTGTLTVTGDLDITGNINSYNVTDLDVTDQTITLGAGQTEANSGGSGIIVDGSGASILWDETNDVFDFNKGLTTTGNVGIGTDNPANQLHLESSGSNYATIRLNAPSNTTPGQFLLRAHDGVFDIRNANNSTTDLTIGSSGDVGIGTSSPVNLSGQTSLTINGSVARVDLQVSQTTTGSVISESGYIHLQPASGGKALIGNGATDLVVDSSGNVGIGKNPSTWRLDVDSSDVYAASFDGSNDTGVVINSGLSSGDIIGYSNSASTYNTLNIRAAAGTGLIVNTSNNVGIGTSSPNISGGSSASTILTVSASASNGNGLLELVGTRANSGDIVSYIRTFNNSATTPITDIRSVRQGSDTTGSLEFYTTNAGTTNKALDISQDGFLTINRNASEYGISIRSAGTRSGLVIQKPGTTSNMGSLLVLSDETYRLGTANHYHTEMLQNGFKRQKTPDGTYFTVTKYFSATGSATTNNYIDLVTTIGATTTGYLMFEVFVTGYASGGLNGVNSGYRVCGYGGHSYSATNYNSLGAGTIQNGYNASTSTVYNATGLSYHPCVNLGSNISNGQVWAYSPGAMQYGFTIVNGSSQTMGIVIVIKGFYS